MTEDEMQKMIEEMAKAHPEMPRALRLTLCYDKTLDLFQKPFRTL